MDSITDAVMQVFEENGYDKKYGKVTLSNRPDLCEYQCNGAMAAAKEYKCAPFMISDKIAEGLAGNPMFESAESVKPGFINLKISPDYLASYVSDMVEETVREGIILGLETAVSKILVRHKQSAQSLFLTCRESTCGRAIQVRAVQHRVTSRTDKQRCC